MNGPAPHIPVMTGKELIPYDPPYDSKALEPRAMERNEAKVRGGFWAKLRGPLGRLPFLEQAVSAYYCAFDPATPRPVKAMLLAALAYFVVPSDLIPDFVAGLGFTDDATVLFATLRLVAGHITEGHRDAARRRLVALGLREDDVPAEKAGEGG
jgi:uncharacterized membrane protein YkvA (DUF1232 family)